MPTPPIPLIRRAHIIHKLKACGAVSPEAAKTFAEVGILNPNGFGRITKLLVKRGVIHETPNGKFYL